MTAREPYGFPLYDAVGSGLPLRRLARLRQRRPGVPAGMGRVFAIRLPRGVELLDGPALLICSWDPETVLHDPRWPVRDSLMAFADGLAKTQSETVPTAVAILENLARFASATGAPQSVSVEGLTRPGVRFSVGTGGWVWAADELPLVVAGSFRDTPELGRVDWRHWPDAEVN